MTGTPGSHAPAAPAHSGPEAERLAQLGNWEALGAPSASQPRLGLLNSMAAAGYRLSQLHQRMQEGTWAGLARLLNSRRNGGPRTDQEQEHVLRWDWQKQLPESPGGDMSATATQARTTYPRPPPPPPGSPTPPQPEQEDARNNQGLRLYNVDSLFQEKEVHDPEPVGYPHHCPTVGR
ncbi:hypothetical protein GCM10020219_104390 [Nonomuraea dietziae]